MRWLNHCKHRAPDQDIPVFQLKLQAGKTGFKTGWNVFKQLFLSLTVKDAVELESSTVGRRWCLAFSIAKGIRDIVTRSLDSPQTFPRKISAMWSD